MLIEATIWKYSRPPVIQALTWKKGGHNLAFNHTPAPHTDGGLQAAAQHPKQCGEST